jgi:hypothetical protein
LRRCDRVAVVVAEAQPVARLEALISYLQTINWPFRSARHGRRWTEGIALRLGNTSAEILGISVWFGGIPLFRPGEKRTLHRDLVLRATRNIS